MKNCLFFIFMTFFCLDLSCQNNDEKKSSLQIESVQMGSLDGDDDPEEFSVKIKFSNTGKTVTDWHFGFFLAGAPLHQIILGDQNYNPRIIRKICDSRKKCVSLKYDRAVSFRDPDLSQGYTSIHSPVKNFPLLKGENYSIEFLHINQWGGVNVSYFPQNLFILTPDTANNNLRLQPLDTSLDMYSVAGYNQFETHKKIQKHLKDNWDKSLPDKNRENVSVIPNPAKILLKRGYFNFHKQSLKVFNSFNDNDGIAGKFLSLLDEEILTVSFSEEADIELRLIPDEGEIKNNPEGYILDIKKNKIIIFAKTEAGLYYGCQTLIQLWRSSKLEAGSVSLKKMKIIDYPRFPYRGILLDTARHFFTVKELKKFIDLMAAHKLNTLHIHFSDDEAFRLNIPDYPRISKVANDRKFGNTMGPMMFVQGNLYGSYKDEKFTLPHENYSGSYSPSDIQEIINYANERQITIIPEIDIPGHARALIKAMPDVFRDPDDRSHYLSLQGYWDNVIPVCTYNTDISVGSSFTKTIDGILNYIGTEFSNQTTVYAIDNEVSIAGDEVSPNAWTQSASCRGEWLNLTAVQKSHKFFHKISKKNTNLKLSGWQQLVQNDIGEFVGETLTSDRVGHVWVWDKSKPGVEQAAALIKRGFPTVLTFSDKTYFDLVYTPDIRETGFAWASKWSDTESALSSVTPTNEVEKLTQSSPKLMGLEGALWSEHLASFDQLIYMSIPKMAGLSEASWSPKRSTSFGKRIQWQSLANRLGCGKKGFLHYLSGTYDIQYRGFPKGVHLEVPKKVCHK